MPPRLRLLGQAGVWLEGGEVRLPTRKALALLAYLALDGPAPRSVLADLLWTELDEDTARKNLRQELHRLGGTPLGPFLALTPDTVALRGWEDSDAAQFQARLGANDLAGALALYGGSLLDGLTLRGAPAFEDWLEARRTALDTEWRSALERHAAGLEAAGDLRGALGAWETLRGADDLRERPYREAMRLHLALGEREAALATFERCRAMLAREFALDPLPETVALAERARRSVPPPEPLSRPRLPGLDAPLIGRGPAWTRLEAAWAAGRPLVLTGEAGVGKSRLLRDFAATRGRFLVNRGQPLDAGVPFSTLARAIRKVWAREGELPLAPGVRRELSRLVPELWPEPPAPLRSEEDRLRLFDAFTDFLEVLYTRVDLLVSDDLHDFDPASLELGNYAAARLAERGRPRPTLAALRVGALRPEAAAALDALVRQGVVEVLELEPLTEGDTAELVTALSGQRARLFPRRLHRATGGNAFFLLETLRGLFEAGELRELPGGGWATPYDEETRDYRELPIPPTVREAVLGRVSRLSPAARRLLEVGSLAGEPFALEGVAQASALDDWEALAALEEATAARLLRESPGGYAFAHDLVRRTLAGSLGTARRTLIHRRLAQDLERRGAPPAVIATHLEQAGQPREAAEHWLAAARAAVASYAHATALAQYGRALEGLPAGHPARPAALLERVDLAYRLGDHAGQARDLDELEASAGGPTLAAALLRRAALHSVQGRPELALGAAERALALFRAAGDARGTAGALQKLSEAAYYAEDHARALSLVREAEELAAGLDAGLLVQALNWRAVMAFTRGEADAALAALTRALEVWPGTRDRYLLARLHNNRATLLALFGAFGRALTDTDAALTITREDGFRHLTGFVLDTRVRALRGLGRLDEARRTLDEALDLARATRNERLTSHCLYVRAELLNDLGDHRAALEAAETALEAATSTHSRSNRVSALVARAGARLALGQAAQALADTREATQLLAQGELREHFEEGVWLAHARALAANGEDASAALDRARMELSARLERLHDPDLRAAFLHTPLARELLNVPA